ncbi:TPA: hypothetical protein NPO56_001376 [Klebsiella quasipneumoniae subsp. quasipneumoniae]|uniref:hypothetical protein n=1 Tax=Klebsiella quasipneumoniae TaxID=1463165 RepID=UPI000E2D0991|nr:hypothetical protein [Klebsiella quasipneumoniae]HCI5779680.1 hypothetical protein [Klebsiella quasipneumoniae subsp. quasipneumoniae]HCI6915957.1 hypothetical protein [Klebsiella quasipneumoniae subsp. similipneumoniae]SXD06249.1 2-polyprenylphenol hydroxylase related flavodoxin oxidoreductase [Klebsiella quasipneumoniae]HCI6119066.1 hypothetical protein [Klebsiella quasipneumoniae subsp. quasipneumoniae]HCI6219623.1 hypothetical protein [Klebsiella quasipneumoniae subsp. quasipneumoniae]
MGIRYTPASFEAAPDGIRTGHKLVGYSAAIRQLDGGQFDDSLTAGLRVVSQIQQGATYGWFHPTVEQNALIWRWIIATLFVLEQKEANGTVDVANGESSAERAVIYAGKNGGMTIYPFSVRMSLATHIEGPAIEKYGLEAGLSLVVKMYQDMTEVNPCSRALRLSQIGREGLAMFHDGFIEMLNTEGMPVALITH